MLRIRAGAIKSKVARRVLLLFIVSALLPVTVTGLLTFGRASQILTQQSHEHLRQLGKSFAMSVYDRLQLAEGGLRQTAALLARNIAPLAPGDGALATQFQALAVLDEGGASTAIIGELGEPPRPDADGRAYLDGGGTLLLTRIRQGRPASVYLLRNLPRQAGNAMLVGRLRPRYLWGAEDSVPYSTSFCVFAEHGPLLECAQAPPAQARKEATAERGERPSQHRSPREGKLSAQWELFLEPGYAAPSWTFVVTEAQSATSAAVSGFRQLFVPVLLISVFTVALLGTTQIRRSLVPLEALMKGTRRLANQEFDSRVRVDSGDEFQELADSFNGMAEQLGKQFNAISTMAEIDRLILSNPSVDRVLELLVERTGDVVPCDCISIAVCDQQALAVGKTYMNDYRRGSGSSIKRIDMPPQGLDHLLTHPEGLFQETRSPSFPVPEQSICSEWAFVLPIALHQRVLGIFSVGLQDPQQLDEAGRGYLRDLSDRVAVALSAAEREKQLYHQAHYDSLTGLPNRQMLRRRLTQELAHAERSGCMLGVLFLDLDRFKNVNDLHGHAEGDRLLSDAAERLQRCVRASDLVARVGGDEFVVAALDIADARQLANMAGNVIEVLSEPFLIAGQQCFVSASVGIAVCPADGGNSEDLIKNADTAMYHAKAHGRGRYQFFTAEMNAEALQRTTLEQELRRAVDRGELFLEYQPQVDPESGRVVGAEALVRWQHPERGRISPASFIPIAEDTDLIDRIGEWVLYTACRQHQAWHVVGAAPDRISVNVSSRQLRRPDLVSEVRRLLVDTGVPAQCLELEITESALMENLAEAIAKLDQLRTLGVRLSMDDFGTGYSSLSHLRQLPLDTLKIDRSFILGVPGDPNTTAITGSVIAMAKNLRKEVVAEGVETLVQLEYLRRHGCDLIQGYYFSRPLGADAFVEFMCASRAQAGAATAGI